LGRCPKRPIEDALTLHSDGREECQGEEGGWKAESNHVVTGLAFLVPEKPLR